MKLNIALLPGDGIGPEVITQAVKCLEAVEETFNHNFEFKEALVGAIAIDKTNNPLPDATLQVCHDADAILFGAIGDPKYDNNPKANLSAGDIPMKVGDPELVGLLGGGQETAHAAIDA